MRKFLKVSIYLCFSIYSGLFFLYLFAYIKPLPIDITNNQLRLYDNTNTIYYESNFNKTSSWVFYEEIPTIIVDAFKTIEDRRFDYHYGIDPIRITTSLLQNLKARKIVAGGSTITQQYARNLFLDQSQTIIRKLKEMFYAIQIEMHYSKEQIMEGYLNTIYFGHGIYGIKDAASFFFGKSVDQLTISDISLLLGSCNSPTYYSPFLYYDNALSKRNQILYALFSRNIISSLDYQTAFLEVPTLVNTKDDINEKLYSAFYKNIVLNELKSLNLLTDDYLERGLQVHTYYNPSVQKALENATKQNMDVESEMQMAGIVAEPFTGNVVAVKGSVDYNYSEYNRTLYASRQIASTIKPLLYYLAMEDGFSPLTTFLSQPTTFVLSDNEVYTPTNFNDYYPNSNISLVYALSSSDNIYAVKTHLFLGTDVLYNTLKSLGYKQTKNIASLALGCVNMSPLELCELYNIFASEGLYTKLHTIAYVTDSDNNLIYRSEHDYQQLFNRDTTLVLTQLLRSPFDITSPNPSLLGYEPMTYVAAKSGTSDWDSWIAGYNPKYTVVIWNGYDDSTPLTKYEERRISRLIFKDFYNYLYPYPNDLWYQISDNLVSIPISLQTHSYNPNGTYYWFKK